MKTRNCLRLLIAILTFSTLLGSAEKLTPEKARDIDRLLEMTGALKMGQQFSDMFIEQMSQALKKALPDIPEGAFEIIQEEVHAVINEEMQKPEGMQNQVRLLYHRHFTHSEIKGIINFYETPLGQKVVQMMPVLTREGMEIGKELGQKVVPVINDRVMKRLREEGYISAKP